MRAEGRLDLAPRPTARLVIGLLVIALGVLFALDNLNLFEAEPVLRFWPVLLIAVGLWKIAQPTSRGGGLTGYLILGLGLVLLANRFLSWLGIYFEVDDLWPLALVVVGLWLVYGAFRRASVAREAAEVGAVDKSTVNAFAFMGGNGVKVASQQFTGGEVVAVMGGCAIDLRGAVAAGGEAVLDVFAIWGGIEIYVPEGWGVESKVLPVMGAFEDNSRRRGGDGATRLVVRGLVVMGGVEVNNGPKDGEG